MHDNIDPFMGHALTREGGRATAGLFIRIRMPTIRTVRTENVCARGAFRPTSKRAPRNRAYAVLPSLAIDQSDRIGARELGGPSGGQMFGFQKCRFFPFWLTAANRALPNS